MMSILDTPHDEGNLVLTHCNTDKNELHNQLLNTEIQIYKSMLRKLCILVN